MSIVVLVVCAGYAWLAFTAWRPLPQRGRGAPWIVALVVGETAPAHLAAGLGVVVVAVVNHWAGGAAGVAAFGLAGAGAVLLAVVHARARQAAGVLSGAVEEVSGRPPRWDRIRAADLARPSAPYPARIRRTTCAYGPHPRHRAVRMEVAGRSRPSPVVLYVHGGGWTGGAPGRQGRPLLRHLADRGWLVFDVGYRLSPEATYPDHLLDLKRAIAWVRATAAEHDADPGFVAVAGGSAGGHLAAMAALTDRRAHPGFEHGDVSVQACVPIYGVHDLTDGGRPKWPYLASHVLKIGMDEDPDAWRAASPIRSATPDRPPFLVLHGALDALVRPEESRRLVAALRAAGGPKVGYAELPGATHGFDSVASVRGLRTAQAVGSALEALYAEHRSRSEEAR